MTDPSPSSVGGHTPEALAAIAREEIPGDASPGFAAVTGSHAFGWADERSDVDLRGFHVADGRRYALLDHPDDQLSATFGTPRPGTADVDFVSYELRAFGRLLADRDLNALEVLFGGVVVLDGYPAEVEALRDAVEHHLPMDVPARYAGMARSNRDAVASGGDVKRALYSIRALLAARFVADHETIVTDVRALSNRVLGDHVLVDDLVAAKRATPDATLDRGLARRTATCYEDLADDPDATTGPGTRDGRTEPGGRDASPDAGGFRGVVDRWMRDVRGWAPE